MISVLETPRLWLRPLEIADAATVQIIFPHWEIVRYLANRVPWPYPADGAYRYYHDHALPAMERGEQWHWTLRLKSNPGAVMASPWKWKQHIPNPDGAFERCQRFE
jgi:hypothetical protein